MEQKDRQKLIEQIVHSIVTGPDGKMLVDENGNVVIREPLTSGGKIVTSGGEPVFVTRPTKCEHDADEG